MTQPNQITDENYKKKRELNFELFNMGNPER